MKKITSIALIILAAIGLYQCTTVEAQGIRFNEDGSIEMFTEPVSTVYRIGNTATIETSEPTFPFPGLNLTLIDPNDENVKYQVVVDSVEFIELSGRTTKLVHCTIQRFTLSPL